MLLLFKNGRCTYFRFHCIFFSHLPYSLVSWCLCDLKAARQKIILRSASYSGAGGGLAGDLQDNCAVDARSCVVLL